MWTEWRSSASHLLAAAVRVRTMPPHPDPAGLMNALSRALTRCDALARDSDVEDGAWGSIRLMICRLLDEALALSCAGCSPCAYEAHGFEHRFGAGMTDVDTAAWVLACTTNPRADRDAMELLHSALSLSRVGPDMVGVGSSSGAHLLDTARLQLAQRLGLPTPGSTRTTRPPKALSSSAPRLRDMVPLWVAAASGAVLATILFIALRVSINASSDPVFASLQAIDVSSADLPASAPALSPAVAAALAPRLATYLKQDIDAGLVLVNDMPDKSIVTIRSDSFFEPGSSVIADPDRMFPLMGRIAAGLNAVPGQALIAGYTDSRHDHSVLYPSNWHLSQDRANVVTSLLAESVDPHRLTAQGRADSQSVGDNATAQGRSENRRVDITLVVGQPS